MADTSNNLTLNGAAVKASKQYLDLPGLTKYDTEIKKVIDSKISAKSTTDNAANTLHLYQGTSTATEVKADGNTYVLRQGGTSSETGTAIATFNLAKDMVVESGVLVTATDADVAAQSGVVKGEKYVKLTIANAKKSVIYIAVNDLVDVYTAAQGATQVQVAVSDANVISASIVAKSVTATELADAVNTDIAKGGTALTAIGDDTTAGTIKYRIKALENVNANANFSSTTGALKDASEFVSVTVAEGTDGKLTATGSSVAVTYASYVAGTNTVTDGIAKGSLVKTIADDVVADTVGTIPAKVGDTATTTVVGYVDAKVAAAEATASANHISVANKTEGHVTVSTTGKVVTIAENDIASAALLGSVSDDSTKATAFGAVAKAKEDLTGKTTDASTELTLNGLKNALIEDEEVIAAAFNDIQSISDASIYALFGLNEDGSAKS